MKKTSTIEDEQALYLRLKGELIDKAAARWARRTRLPLDELVSVANLGFCEALRAFDSSKSANFAAFAGMCIKRKLIDYYRWSRRAPPRRALMRADRGDQEAKKSATIKPRRAVDDESFYCSNYHSEWAQTMSSSADWFPGLLDGMAKVRRFRVGQLVLEARSAGHSLRSCAERLGCSRSSVLRLLLSLRKELYDEA